MLLPSDITYNTRVQRSARTLAAGGWEVTVAHVSQDGHATASADGYRLVGVPWPAFDDRVEAARGAVRRATAKRHKLEAALGRQPSAPADAERLEAARKKEAARRRTLKRAVVDGKVGVPTPLRRAWLAVLRRERPQVIHTHDQAGLATAFAGRGPATAVVYDAHEHTLGKDHKRGRRRPLERYLRRRVPAADAVITVSAALAQTLQREL